MVKIGLLPIVKLPKLVSCGYILYYFHQLSIYLSTIFATHVHSFLSQILFKLYIKLKFGFYIDFFQESFSLPTKIFFCVCGFKFDPKIKTIFNLYYDKKKKEENRCRPIDPTLLVMSINTDKYSGQIYIQMAVKWS